MRPGRGHIVCQFYVHFKHGVSRKPVSLTPRYVFVIDSLMRLDEGYEGFTQFLGNLRGGKVVK